MIAIPSEQALQRWDVLPMVLREALYSEPNSDFLWKTCEGEHIPDEKIYGVARIAGYVLMGFLHPEDMAEELKEQLGFNLKVGASIAGAINQRIFAPLRQDIGKAYEPLSKFDGGPKIIQEIKPAISAAPAPQIISQAAAGGPVAGTPPPGAPKPKLPEVGWSKLTPEEPVVKLSQAAAPRSAPRSPLSPVSPPAPKPAAAAPQVKSSIDEFERIAMRQGPQKSVLPVPPAIPPTATPAPASAMGAPKPTGPAEPAPIIIHEDAAFKPQQKTPDFRIQLPTEKFDAQKSAGQAAVKPAVLELGKAALPPGAPKPGMISSPRVVHYTEYKSSMPGTPAPTPSPVSKTPLSPQGPRQIIEITSPKPPSAPTPPTSPPPPPLPQKPT